jgi:hypothetical protein
MTESYKECDFQKKFILFLLGKLSVNIEEGVGHCVYTLYGYNIYYWKDLAYFYGLDRNDKTYFQHEICYLLAEKLGYERF